LGLLRVWDAYTGEILIDFQGVSPEYVTSGLSWSPDSSRIVSAADDGVVRIWSVSYPNYSPGQLITTISPTTQDSGFVEDVAWSPNGQMIAVGRVYTRFTLEIWNATNYTFINHFAADWVTKLSWNATSSQIAYADQNSRLGILNITSTQQQTVALGTSDGACTVSWNTTNNDVAIGYVNGEVSIWNPSDKVSVSTMIDSPPTYVENIAWSPDNSQIATANGDKHIRLWNSRTGELIQVMDTDVNIYAMAFSPDGSQIAYGTKVGTVQFVPVLQTAVPLTYTLTAPPPP